MTRDHMAQRKLSESTFIFSPKKNREGKKFLRNFWETYFEV